MKDNVAVLLPSYKRKKELEMVLRKTNIKGGKFIVVANYPADEYAELANHYSDRAVFFDESAHGKLGVCGAYNKAFEIAREQGFKYCILFADDVLPFKKSWLHDSVVALEEYAASIGVFSSDECHFGSYGWNIIKDAPIGHFLIARISDLDMFFDLSYLQYVIDLEIIVRSLKQGKKILLLPVRLNHLRSPLNRETYGQNYDKDLATFLKNYPEYKNSIGGGERYIPETKAAIEVYKDWVMPKMYPWPKHKQSKVILPFGKRYKRNAW